MANPKVSICCPAYNCEKFSKETVNSFVNQSFNDIEILIPDDCSSDNTINIIKENFTDVRIKLFEQNINLGPSDNANFLFKIATGDYIALCASDDVMHCERIKKSIEFFEDNPEFDMVYTFIKIIDEKSEDIPSRFSNLFNKKIASQNLLKHFFYYGNFICAPSAMIRKSVFEKILFNPCLIQSQDFDFWIKMLLSDMNIGCIEEQLTFYRIHGGNLSLPNDLAKQNELNSSWSFECSKILENYSNLINDRQKFERIFGFDIADEKLIKFAIAKEALTVKSRSHYLFALNIIYNEFLDKNIRDLIFKKYFFGLEEYKNLCKNFNNTNLFIKKKPLYKKIFKKIFKLLLAK